jgi:NTE family protein
VSDNNKLALALSGGGVRAMVFHAGVLLYLAERGYLEAVNQLSSVSGGSLLIGMIYKENNYIWPTSDDYKDKVYPSIKRQLCSKSLQFWALIEMLKPNNWIYILSRANVIAKTIDKLWGISKKLNHIPDYPVWSINGTNAENGKRFRFKHDTCGDYSIGYSKSREFKIAEAIAASAAFPGGIGPLVIQMNKHVWKKRQKWNDPDGTEITITPQYKTIHIYDGGVYDNLGTEPLFDIGRGVPKQSGYAILVSDAGSPFSNTFSMRALNPFRLMRILDITMDQSRSLRVRSLMNYFLKDKKNGGYLMIGQNPKSILSENELKQGKWLSDKQIKIASSYGTNLSKIDTNKFNLIARHGYEAAKSIDLIKEGIV